jgi:hypothetical protein
MLSFETTDVRQQRGNIWRTLHRTLEESPNVIKGHGWVEVFDVRLD